MSERILIGWQPWLPWPLSAWRWWTEPVRAEYLAVLRVGVAAVLLCDILLTYLPQTDIFFGPESLGSPEVFANLHAPGAWRWSLWHGLGNPLLSCLALSAWLVCTALLILGFWARLTTTGPQPPAYLLWLLFVWLAATLVTVLGLWARADPDSEHTSQLHWLAPLAALVASTLLLAVDFVRTWQAKDADRPLRRALISCWFAVALLVVFGFWKRSDGSEPGSVWWPLSRWEDEPRFLLGAVLVWAAATAFLLLGLATRWAAVLVWLISTSFAHLNSYIDNAGDTVRGIILFYLMLCPCGAAWSLDDYLARRRGSWRGVVYVSPWPLRLLFVQMVFIYWMNGLYKLLGEDWIHGESFYYVMCDLAVTRFSYAQVPLPYVVTWLVTLFILFWELTFPLWMPFRRTRVAALGIGALFHLGIFVQMELGGFAPYMLCLYLPLLPWDRWLKDSPKSA
jgi:hypothetical protein